jgi:uncharacterized protein YcfJ
MLDEKTNKLIEELEKTAAADQSTGMSQVKKRTQVRQKDYEGEGAGLGALLGAGSGALSKKYKALASIAGAVGGGLAGRALGKRTIGTQRTSVTEGTVKKQERKAENADVPRLTDQKVLKLIESNKK